MGCLVSLKSLLTLNLPFYLFSLCFPRRACITRASRLLILILNREVWSGSVFSSRFPRSETRNQFSNFSVFLFGLIFIWYDKNEIVKNLQAKKKFTSCNTLIKIKIKIIIIFKKHKINLVLVQDFFLSSAIILLKFLKSITLASGMTQLVKNKKLAFENNIKNPSKKWVEMFSTRFNLEL